VSLVAPGSVLISSELIGRENRTLTGLGQTNGTLNLISGVDIVVFSNATVFNLSWSQANDMDIVTDYIIMAEVRIHTLCLK